MPYEAARCLLDAGELEQARELIERYSFASGPLGVRLAATLPDLAESDEAWGARPGAR